MIVFSLITSLLISTHSIPSLLNINWDESFEEIRVRTESKQGFHIFKPSEKSGYKNRIYDHVKAISAESANLSTVIEYGHNPSTDCLFIKKKLVSVMYIWKNQSLSDTDRLKKEIEKITGKPIPDKTKASHYSYELKGMKAFLQIRLDGNGGYTCKFQAYTNRLFRILMFD